MVKTNRTNKKVEHKKNHNKMTKKKTHNYGNKSMSFKQLNCSPTKKLKYTCYSPRNLHNLKKKWNKEHPHKKIESNDPYHIWKSLKGYMSTTCKNERCWLRQNFMQNKLNRELATYTFAPNSPETWKKNPNEWLNSNDIINVMRQYEYKYPNFKFIGPSPIDFDKKKMFGQCVWNDLCNFSLRRFLNKGITKIGIILNTDPHYLSGSHWVCIVINTDRKFIFYFDSNADKTPKQVKIFINRVKSQAKNIGIDLQEYVNKTEHQFKDTECGMYVLYIIINLLTTNSLPNFNKRIPDKEMEKFRKIFFN